MKNESADNTFRNVKRISISRMNQGYNLAVDGRQEIELPDATNFEWRIVEGGSPSLYHMYFGNESGDANEYNFYVTFTDPCEVRITNGHPRCYIHIERSK